MNRTRSTHDNGSVQITNGSAQMAKASVQIADGSAQVVNGSAWFGLSMDRCRLQGGFKKPACKIIKTRY